jgi:hypothetical protein
MIWGNEPCVTGQKWSSGGILWAWSKKPWCSVICQEKFCCVEFIVVSKFISCKVCYSYQCTGENLEEIVLVYSKFHKVTKKNNENFNKFNYICMCLLYVFLVHVKCTSHFILLNYFTQISVNNTNYEATHLAVLSSLLLHFAFILCAGVCG